MPLASSAGQPPVGFINGGVVARLDAPSSSPWAFSARGPSTSPPRKTADSGLDHRPSPVLITLFAPPTCCSFFLNRTTPGRVSSPSATRRPSPRRHQCARTTRWPSVRPWQAAGVILACVVPQSAWAGLITPCRLRHRRRHPGGGTAQAPQTSGHQQPLPVTRSPITRTSSCVLIVWRCRPAKGAEHGVTGQMADGTG
jgi:hypothetical protein